MRKEKAELKKLGYVFIKYFFDPLIVYFLKKNKVPEIENWYLNG